MVLCFWAEQGCNLLRQGIHTLWCVSHTGVAVGTASWHIVAAMSFGQGHCLHSPLWLGEIVICSGRGFTHCGVCHYPVAAMSFGQALTLPAFSTMVDLPSFSHCLQDATPIPGPMVLARVRWLPLSARQQWGGMGMVASRWQ